MNYWGGGGDLNEFAVDKPSPFVRVYSSLSGTGKICLAYGPKRLTRYTKDDVICLQTKLTRRNEKFRMSIGIGRHTS